MPSRTSHAVAALVVASAVAAGLPAAAEAKAKPATLKVMTRNIYLGGNIFLPIGAPDRTTFEAKTQELWNQVRFTDFPARAKLLANEVRDTDPDLIGLQEVALWRRSADGVKDGSATPSTRVVYDFLALLRKELKARKLHYRPAVVQREADIEAPTQRYDVRLTMRDVILVRTGRGAPRIRSARGRQFTADIGVPVQTGVVTSKRGWTAVDASKGGHRFRYVNTHLESATEAPRVAQAKELVARGGPARTPGRVIVGGDLNSDRLDKTGASPVAYRTIRGAGFNDAWLQARRGRETPYTCCLRTPTANDRPPFPGDHRIDHLLFKGAGLRSVKATVVGTDRRNRTKSGLWPSDHGGWVATFRLR